MELIYKTENGRLFHGDNIEVMKKIKDNTVDSCISDFPYAIEFMGKNWDSSKCWNQGEGKHGTFEGTGYTGKKRPAFYLNSNEDKLVFYNWCYERAIELHRIIKHGGYVCIFGHPKTNHRMKSAFEDAGFNIVEEIDWVYGTGFPKNQDIGKLFDKKAGIQGESLGIAKGANSNPKGYKTDGVNGSGGHLKSEYETFAPATDQAIKWNGWKTAGLKPAHEPITIFQKPLEGTYINNINTYGVGAMNIDACRIPFDMSDTNPATNPLYRKQNKYKINHGIDKNPSSYALKHEVGEMNINNLGRFPANMIFDTYMGEELDNQSGISKSTGGHGDKSKGALGNSVYGKYKNEELATNAGGLGDTGGASRYFLKIEEEDFVPFLYCAKPTKKEKGEGNSHVTVKPKTLIKWLIKLVTPLDGKTIDITAGSGTHGLACEELNGNEGYNLRWIDVELLNTEKEPYCEIAMDRIKNII